MPAFRYTSDVQQPMEPSQAVDREGPSSSVETRLLRDGLPTPVTHTVCDIAGRKRFRIGIGVPVPLRIAAAISLSSR